MPVGQTQRKRNPTSLEEVEKELFSRVPIVADYEAEFVLVVAEICPQQPGWAAGHVFYGSVQQAASEQPDGWPCPARGLCKRRLCSCLLGDSSTVLVSMGKKKTNKQKQILFCFYITLLQNFIQVVSS